jgi:hypothetical protein
MAASHLNMFQQSTANESEIVKLIEIHFLLDHAVFQWWPAKGEDIPTPNTKEIVVFFTFLQHGFGLPTSDFVCGLLHHYKIELVHRNPNSIIQISIFVHLCEAFIDIPRALPYLRIIYS